MKKRATKRNEVVGNSKRREEIEGINGGVSEVSFFNQEITKYN